MAEVSLAYTTGESSAAAVPRSLLEAQRNVLEMVVQNVALGDVLAALCKIVEEHAPRDGARASILLVTADGKRLTIGAAPSLPESYCRAIDGIEIAPHVGTCAAAAARREVVVTPDISADPSWLVLRQLPLSLGLKAAWSLPIVSATGAVLGTFGTYFPETRAPHPEERQLVEVLARTAALAIERQRSDRASRARIEYAVRVSGIGFWHWDLALGEVVWDERVRGHFFIPDNRRLTTLDFFTRLHPDDREVTRAAVRAAIDRREHYEVTYRTVDPASGATKWIRSVGAAQYDADGKPVHFGGVAVDVTEQNAHEQSLRDLNERLQQQDRRKDEFLATLAHELRNPLAPVRTGLEILKISADPAQIARTREMMERQLGHLVRLVDDLLDVSRITLGKVVLKKEHIDFRVILNGALEATRSLVGARGHEITLQVSEQPLPLLADPTRLIQVVANLVNNAARYTPAGGRIQLTAEARQDTLIARVIDSGVGMDSDLLDRVFDMFVQGVPASGESQAGLGVGLTLVRRLVEMHGGSIEAQSPGRDQGSTFVLRLPLAS